MTDGWYDQEYKREQRVAAKERKAYCVLDVRENYILIVSRGASLNLVTLSLPEARKIRDQLTALLERAPRGDDGGDEPAEGG